jgi:hypothetical protein
VAERHDASVAERHDASVAERHDASVAERHDAPGHWTWRDGEIQPGPAVVVDVDGVLSDAASRQHYLEAPRRDWNGFFEACGDDPVIDEMRVLLELLDPRLQVVLLTARPRRVHELTEAWLRRYAIRWDLLLMRPRGEYEESRAFKRASVGHLRSYGFDLRLAIEDDRRNVEMFRREGVPCVYFHSGYYD